MNRLQRRLDAARRAIDELARHGTSPTEIAIARFDLRVAERDTAAVRPELARLESSFAQRPDLEDRREIACALADALEGRRDDARRKLRDHRGDGPRFWDHAIRLALALADELHACWLRDLEEVGPRLGAAPLALPEPKELLRGRARLPVRGAPTPRC